MGKSYKFSWKAGVEKLQELNFIEHMKYTSETFWAKFKLPSGPAKTSPTPKPPPPLLPPKANIALVNS